MNGISSAAPGSFERWKREVIVAVVMNRGEGEIVVMNRDVIVAKCRGEGEERRREMAEHEERWRKAEEKLYMEGWWKWGYSFERLDAIFSGDWRILLPETRW